MALQLFHYMLSQAVSCDTSVTVGHNLVGGKRRTALCDLMGRQTALVPRHVSNAEGRDETRCDEEAPAEKHRQLEVNSLLHSTQRGQAERLPLGTGKRMPSGTVHMNEECYLSVVAC